jgi:hypothetical protein
MRFGVFRLYYVNAGVTATIDERILSKMDQIIPPYRVTAGDVVT